MTLNLTLNDTNSLKKTRENTKKDFHNWLPKEVNGAGEFWLLVSEPGKKRKWAVLVAPLSKSKNSTTVLHHFSSRIDLDRSPELNYR